MKLGNSENYQGDEQRKPMVTCAYSNGETESVQEVPEKLCDDETMRECELPELTVCYNEIIEHVVKDICVDEGVPYKDKFFFETLVDESKIERACLYPEKERVSELLKGMVDPSACPPDGIKHLDSRNMDNQSDDKSKPKYSVRSVEDCAEDKNSENNFKEPISPNIATPKQSGILEDCSADKTVYDQIKETKSPANKNRSAKVPESNSDAHESSHIYREQCTQIPNDEAKLGSFASVSNDGGGNTAEEAALAMHQSSVNAESDPLTSSNNSDNNQVPGSGSSPLNRDLPTPASSSGGEHPKNDLRELVESENASKTESEHSDQCLVSDRVQKSNGEASFSVTGNISGRISYSGPAPYSGSVSMRSESSTTSARSFAFPVLQSEWNSSPVRMEKADRRYLRKHKRWKKALLCCRC